MDNELKNAVSSVPAGLVACRLGGRQAHIVTISPDALRIRLSQPEPIEGALEVCFRQMNGAWENIRIEQYQAEPAHCETCGVLVRLSFSDESYRRAFHRSMTFYADYIRAYADGDFSGLTGCLDDTDTFSDNQPAFPDLRLPENKEICLSLHDFDLYALYLNHSLAEFLTLYAERKRIEPLGRIHRLYIGNSFCRQLFPGEILLAKLLWRAKEDGLAVTLVTAPDPRLPESVLQTYSGEMTVSDWGLLYRLRDYPDIQPVLGVLLNKRKKDPRMNGKPDLNPELLRENSLNSAEFRAFLADFGVNRLEFERCGYDYAVPAGSNSLHLPWYQTNTSVYCPLRALCEHGDRARQSDDDGCPGYCRENGLLYPEGLNIYARWNSLFAMDRRPLGDLAAFDRIVLNL